MKTRCRGLVLAVVFLLLLGNVVVVASEQVDLGARAVPIIEVDGLEFKDLNNNGELDRYEDWRLPVEERVENLLSLMTIEEKVGLMLHPNMSAPADGVIPKEGYYAQSRGQDRYFPAPSDLIVDTHINHILNNGVVPPATMAAWSNGLQEIAEGTRLGIPVTFSSDPRHGAALIGHVTGTQHFSGWPSREGSVGVSATRDPALAEEWGRIVAAEYRAVGLHMLLGPSIDVGTDPRWSRMLQSFSESAELTSEMVVAFINGALTEKTGPNSMAIMVKHWPGSGPHLDGTGRLLVYPGDNFEYHLMPFRDAFEAGAQSTMPYYSGTEYDGLGAAFSEFLIQDVLKSEVGFDGIVCTDWGAIRRTGPLHPDYVELGDKDRFAVSLDAGIDQIGGESDPTEILELVAEGRISEERINESAAKFLTLKYELGLFENPYVDTSRATTIVGNDEFMAKGYEAQLKSIVLLSNNGILPYVETQLDVAPNMLAARKTRVFVSGMEPTIAGQYADVIEDPEQADLIILRMSVSGFTADDGSVDLTFPEESLAMVKAVAATGNPVVVAVNLHSNLTVLPQELLDVADAVIMTFDVLDTALLDVVFGHFNPTGKLPFDLPSSMESVREQNEDIPFDHEDPLFEYGHGLSY